MALLVAAAAPAPERPLLPGVGPVDPRVPVDATAAPWRAIGRVQGQIGNDARWTCTGFLIGPRLAMTAAHCLYNPRTRGFMRPSSVHFLLGYERGGYPAHTVLTALAVAPGYDPAHGADTLGADWAVLLLAEPLGTPDRILALAPADEREFGRLSLGGYDQDRIEMIEADLDCTLGAWEADRGGRPLIRHTCSGTHGTSGAPLLARRGSAWVVVGLQVAAARGRSAGLAVPAVTLKQIERQALAWIGPPS